MNAPVSNDSFSRAPSRWRQLVSHPDLAHYQRLFALVLACNFAVFCALHWAWPVPSATLQHLLDLSLANLALAIVIRQQRVINLLFGLVLRAPLHWPLWLRRNLAKVYHFGGLHSAAAVAATAWFTLYAWGLSSQAWYGEPVSLVLLSSSAALVVLTASLCVMALPQIRSRWHDRFEQVHRLGGWSALLLLWVQSLVSYRQGVPDAHWSLWLQTPTAWLLCLLTACIIAPWLQLRKVPVRFDKPSSHALVAHFDHGVTPFAGSSTSISHHPLGQWHAFANIPTPGRSGFRLVISRAGDWTGRLIDSPPSHVWVKGVPTAGVARVERLFSSVLYVATGSGIGPVLPHLLAGQVPCRLLWVTRNPVATYGQELVDEVLWAQPHAQIWDSDQHGKPDLLALTLATLHNHPAQAVICIANQAITRNLVQQLELKGIPAYGAIWDS